MVLITQINRTDEGEPFTARRNFIMPLSRRVVNGEAGKSDKWPTVSTVERHWIETLSPTRDDLQ